MSDITVNVTNAGAANVSVSGGSTVNATVGNGGAVNVSLGMISPGNATVVSGTLTINSTTTLSAGTPAYVKNDAGTAYAAKLDIGIPAGPATLVSVGNTTTLAAGSNATVSGTASGGNLTLSFGIPAGVNGINGVTPSFAIGNVVTGAAGSSASVTATATNGGANVTLDLTIPRGDPGASGSNGINGTSITLSDATPANLGTASAGSSNLAARADHIHSLPVIAYGNITGLPSNFPTNATLVSGLNTSYAAISHAHNYVTGLNNLTGNLTLAAGANVTLVANGSTLTLSAAAGLGANDVIDGGYYVGEPLVGILFTSQPQSANATSTTTINISALAQIGSIPQSAAAISGGLIGCKSSVSYPFTYVNFATSVSVNNGTGWTTAFTDAIQPTTAVYTAPSFPTTTASNGTRTVVASYKIAYSDSPTDISSWSGTSYSWDLTNTGGYTVAFNGTRFAAVKKNSYSINEGNSKSIQMLSSSDGAAWSPRSLPRTENASRGVVTSCRKPLVAVSGKFVVCGVDTQVGSVNTYYPYLWTSTDGITWTKSAFGSSVTNSDPSAIPPIDVFSDIASSGTIAVGVTGTTSARYTSNGTAWGTATLPVACNCVSYAAGFFWAFNGSLNSADVCYSRDGVSWTLGSMPSALLWQEMVGETVGYATGGARATIGETYGTASLSVSTSITGGGTVSYQWQLSTDAGATWTNISGATSSTLALTNLTSADNGKRYRVAASATGATTAYSQAAILTVN